MPRELMKGAIDATAPTARTYSLALQVNVLKEIEGFVFFFFLLAVGSILLSGRGIVLRSCVFSFMGVYVI